MRKPYVRSILTVLILTLVELIAFAANDSPQTFTLDGQLYASDRTSPLLDATAKIRVQILDPSKNCILYEEEQPVDTTSSGGHFSIQVGSVVGSIKRKAMDAGNTMQKLPKLIGDCGFRGKFFAMITAPLRGFPSISVLMTLKPRSVVRSSFPLRARARRL